MVKRFQMKTEHDWVCARPDPKGDWVRFSDYEAAERLAGARVKMPSGELCRYIEQCREISNGGEYPWWSRLAEILSALAEPAGEAEPCQFLPTEDGEFNGNTFGNGDDVPFGWITQRAYDHAYTTSDPVQVTILRTESGPGLMPRVPLYTTPPDASAIREALPATRPYVDRLIRIFRDRPDDDTSAVVLQDYARSALAGSAE